MFSNINKINCFLKLDNTFFFKAITNINKKNKKLTKGPRTELCWNSGKDRRVLGVIYIPSQGIKQTCSNVHKICIHGLYMRVDPKVMSRMRKNCEKIRVKWQNLCLLIHYDKYFWRQYILWSVLYINSPWRSIKHFIHIIN